MSSCHSSSADIFPSLQSYVMGLGHPFHGEDSRQVHFEQPICSILMSNSYQWWSGLHWQNLQIEPTKYLMCLGLLVHIHTNIPWLHTHSKVSFIFEISTYHWVVSEEEHIFIMSFDQLIRHVYVKMYLFIHPDHLVLHWILPWEVIQKPNLLLFQNQYPILSQ